MPRRRARSGARSWDTTPTYNGSRLDEAWWHQPGGSLHGIPEGVDPLDEQQWSGDRIDIEERKP